MKKIKKVADILTKNWAVWSLENEKLMMVFPKFANFPPIASQMSQT